MRDEEITLDGGAGMQGDVGRAYLARPEPDFPPPWPLLLAIHGSGRNALSYRDVPFYRRQRDIALAAGYLFAAVSNGPDAWGTDRGLRRIELLREHILSRPDAGPGCVLWATSAGGVLMHRFVDAHRDTVLGAIGTFPVYDLLDSFGRSPGCALAWGARSLKELERAVRGRNPPELIDSLVSTPYLIFHGREDLTVPPGPHSIRFRDEAAERGARVELVLTAGGHSTENAAVYDERIDAALRRWRKGSSAPGPTAGSGTA